MGSSSLFQVDRQNTDTATALFSPAAFCASLTRVSFGSGEAKLPEPRFFKANKSRLRVPRRSPSKTVLDQMAETDPLVAISSPSSRHALFGAGAIAHTTTTLQPVFTLWGWNRVHRSDRFSCHSFGIARHGLRIDLFPIQPLNEADGCRICQYRIKYEKCENPFSLRRPRSGRSQTSL